MVTFVWFKPNPLMLQCLFCGYPLSWIECQHFLNQVFSVHAYMLPFVLRKQDLSTEYPCLYFLVCFAKEWRCSSQENVQDDSQGPDVTFLIVFLAKHFRGHIINLRYKVFTLPTFRLLFSRGL